MRKEDDGLDQSALTDDAELQQWKSKFNAVAPRLNYTAAEQAGAKVPVRRDQNKRNREAEGEAGEGVQGRQVKRQLCEDCQETTTSYGLLEEGRRRWCEPCSRLHAGAISLIRRNVKPAGANKRKAAASKASHAKRGQGQERGAASKAAASKPRSRAHIRPSIFPPSPHISILVGSNQEAIST